MSARVTSVDRGLARVAQRLAGKGARVRVGILADAPKETEGTPSRATLLEVAAIQEFGAPGADIPQRSFIRATVDEKQGEIRATQGALARQIIASQVDAPVALERLGARVVGYMKQRIAQGIAPPNAPSTIAKKGSSKPLVDVGQLRSAISYHVDRK